MNYIHGESDLRYWRIDVQMEKYRGKKKGLRDKL